MDSARKLTFRNAIDLCLSVGRVEIGRLAGDKVLSAGVIVCVAAVWLYFTG